MERVGVLKDGLRTAYRRIKSWDALAILTLAAWPLVFYWPVALGRMIFSEGDLNWIHYPLHAEMARALAQGRLPLWSPSVQAGIPLFAEGQVGALYPITLFFHLWLPYYYALGFAILFNLAWVAVGMYLLARSCRLGVTSSFLAGMVVGAGGFLTARTSHPEVTTVASWLPWLMLLQHKYWQARLDKRSGLSWLLLASGAIAVQFLGGSQHLAFLNLIAFAFFGLLGPFVWVDEREVESKALIFKPIRWLPQSVIATGLPVLIGAGLAAVQLLPTFELMELSVRGGQLGKAFSTGWSLDPAALSQFLAPFSSLGLPSADNMEFWGYIGITPFFLAICAPILRRDSRTVIMLLFALLTLTLALGGNTPLYDWLYSLPLVTRFRVPARMLFLFTFAAAFLAATGMEVLLKRLPRSSGQSRFAVVLGLTSVALFCAVAIYSDSAASDSWAAIWPWLPAVWLLAIAAALAATRLGVVARDTFGMLILFLSVLDLASFSTAFLPTLSRMSAPSEVISAPRTVRSMDASQPIYRVTVNKFPSVTMSAARASLWSGLPMLYGKEGVILGYMPFSLALKRNEEYIQQMTVGMRNQMNVRYNLLPLETAPAGNPNPFDESEPNGGLTLDILAERPRIPSTPVSTIEVTSYTDHSEDLRDGFIAGQIELGLETGETIVVPLRVGVETADWAFDGLAGIGTVNHSKPAAAESFPAYTRSVGHDFLGHKYVAQVRISAADKVVVSVGARSFLPGSGLTIERISMIDSAGKSISLAGLVGRSDLALSFRSHTAAMWENRDAMPRAFIVHRADVVSDEEALARLRETGFPYDQVALLADASPNRVLSGQDASKPKDTVTITEYKPERVAIQTETDRPGYLILTDSWYPGWLATVDGRPAAIHRADYVFRAVELAPGLHTVVFEYRPMSLVWGAAISGISLMLCLGIALRELGILRSARARLLTGTIS